MTGARCVAPMRAEHGKMHRPVGYVKGYSPPSVNRIWLWVYHDKIPIYPNLYLLKGDFKLRVI